MVSGFICGTHSFPREDDEYERQTRSADSSPRRSRSKSSSNKNPYSSRGLDKFTALLAEIEEKRQQIYSQVDPDEISLVRFSYSGDHDFKPIVVKAKHKASPDRVVEQPKSDTDLKTAHLRKLQSSKSLNVREENKAENEINMKKKKMGCIKKIRIEQWKEPKLILLMVVILILVFLVLFGRSFAIMCTSIGWYVIPTMSKTSVSPTNSKVSKKDYTIRRLSHKTLMTNERHKIL
uniref:ZCF37 n=2 Tax=Chenopodium quinoa TaxID=63459 RepID=A0A803MYR0_CHEQI